MKVIVDAMGGDNAPRELVLGALEAVKRSKVDVLLVGKGESILKVFADEGLDLPDHVEIADATEVIEMCDDPTKAVREKKNSSMVVGLRMLAEGQGDVFVSAGSTGALLTGATLIEKRVRGIRRAALGSLMPSFSGGKWLLIDCGANVECTAEYLLQFAYMGSFYLEKMLGVSKPRIGILNIGTETSKGGELQKEAYALIKAESDAGRLNFVGNIESREVMSGLADVIVCDGFTGNILLKGIEGVGLGFYGLLKNVFMKNIFSKLAALMVRKNLKDIKSLMDYNSVGGAPLLGITKPVYKIHGSAGVETVANGIENAVKFVNSGIIGSITENIEHMKVDVLRK